jgi:hypothetical protein
MILPWPVMQPAIMKILLSIGIGTDQVRYGANSTAKMSRSVLAKGYMDPKQSGIASTDLDLTYIGICDPQSRPGWFGVLKF